MSLKLWITNPLYNRVQSVIRSSYQFKPPLCILTTDPSLVTSTTHDAGILWGQTCANSSSGESGEERRERRRETDSQPRSSAATTPLTRSDTPLPVEEEEEEEGLWRKPTCASELSAYRENICCGYNETHKYDKPGYKERQEGKQKCVQSMTTQSTRQRQGKQHNESTVSTLSTCSFVDS